MSNNRQQGCGDGRGSWKAASAVALLLALLPATLSQAQHAQAPHFSARQNQPPAGPARQPGWNQSQQPQPQSQPQHPSRGQHLPEWMANHQNQNPGEREQALRREPGFSHLPEPQQQQLINRLHKLDSAPPQVRQRILARNEIFERLPPEQKQQIREASQTLSQMPPDRNMALRHAFRDLRGLPPGQRINVLNSARFQAEFSPQERTVLGNLLSIEPY